MTEKEKQLNAWLNQIADELNITDTMLDRAISSYEAVGKWLSEGIECTRCENRAPGFHESWNRNPSHQR